MLKFIIIALLIILILFLFNFAFFNYFIAACLIIFEHLEVLTSIVIQTSTIVFIKNKVLTGLFIVVFIIKMIFIDCYLLLA